MSHPVDFFQSNMVVKGEHLSTLGQEVGNLPMYREEHDGGGATYWSCWSINEEELAAIRKHGSIFIGLVNPDSFPVMCVLAPGDVVDALSGDGSED